MNCPHCKLSLGWGPALEYPEGTKWYKRVEPQLKCRHCGKYVVAEKNEKYWWLFLTCILVALYLIGFQTKSEYFMLAIIVVLVGFVYAIIGYARSCRFKKYEET